MVQTRQTLRKILQPNSKDKTENFQRSDSISSEQSDFKNAAACSSKDTCSEGKIDHMDPNINIKAIDKNFEKVIRIGILNENPNDQAEVGKLQKDATKSNGQHHESKSNTIDNKEESNERKGHNNIAMDHTENDSISMSEIDEDISAIFTEIEEDNLSSEFKPNAIYVRKSLDKLPDNKLDKNLEDNVGNYQILVINPKSDEYGKQSPDFPEDLSTQLSGADEKYQISAKENALENQAIETQLNDTEGDLGIIKEFVQDLICISVGDKSDIIPENIFKKTQSKNVVTSENSTPEKTSVVNGNNEFFKSSQAYLNPTKTPSFSKRNDDFVRTLSQERAVWTPTIQRETNPASGPETCNLKIYKDAKHEHFRGNKEDFPKGKRPKDLTSGKLSKKPKMVEPFTALSSPNNHPIEHKRNPFIYKSILNQDPAPCFKGKLSCTSSTNTGSTLTGSSVFRKSRKNPRRRFKRKKAKSRSKAQEIILKSSSGKHVSNLGTQTEPSMFTNVQQNQKTTNTKMPTPQFLTSEQIREQRSTFTTQQQRSILAQPLNETTDQTPQPCFQGMAASIMETLLNNGNSGFLPNTSVAALLAEMHHAQNPKNNSVEEPTPNTLQSSQFNCEAHSQPQNSENSCKIVIVHALHPLNILSQAHIETIKRNLLFEVENAKNIKTNLGFFDCSIKDGGLLLTCNHVHTKNWVVNEIATLKPFPQGSLRAIEESAQPMYLCFVPLSRDNVMPFCQLLLRLEKQNYNLSTKHWQLLTSVPDIDMGKKLLFSIDELSKERILAQSCRLFLNFGQINVEIVDKRGQIVTLNSNNNQYSNKNW